MGISYLPQFGNLSHSSISSGSNANKMLVFITILIVNACIAGTIPATPENITVTFLTPTTVRVSWQTMIDLNAHPVEKYIVTYKPTDDRVVQDVAGNSEAIILDRLSPSTQYSIAVTAIWLGKKYRSRQIIFRTLDVPKPSSQQDYLTGGGGVFSNAAGGHGVGVNLSSGGLADGAAPGGSGGASGGRATNGSIFGDDVTSTATNTLPHGTHRELPTIRGVEIGIVLIVLMVWAGAIALFFNRWGKIRMLLPYQPDYKHEQLKVPGTGVCSSGACNGQHSHQHFHMLQEESTVIAERCTRSRINSAIFVSSEGRGFDSIEFLRRHGSQSVLCRKARSAENITDNGRKKSFSEKRQWHEDDVETDGHNDADVYAKDDNANNFIELQERRRPSNETRTLSVLQASIGNSHHNGEQTSSTIAGIATSVLGGCHSAAVTTSTSNMVVGSISIEAPPAYIKEDLQHQHQLQLQLQPSIASNNSTSHDSTDTVEELILIPTAPEATRSRVLVHQRSSTSSHTNRSQSPALSSAHSSPKALRRKGVKPKIGTLPMVSVSGPSPPHEKQPLPAPPSECL